MEDTIVDLSLEPVVEPAPHQDISFDLETLGLKHDAMILAIGAVKFNRDTGEIGEQFYRVVDITAPCGGGTITPSTVVWWMNQSAEAREAVFSNNPASAAARVDLRQALVEFSEFVGFNDDLPEGTYPDVTMWQRGDKDGQWLEAAYEGMQLKLPYQFWQLDNQRTLTSLFKPFLPVRYGVAHNALDDALYQAQCLVNVFKRLETVGAFAADAQPDIRPAPSVLENPVAQMVLSTAYACGLNTVAEAIRNIDMHAMSIWAYPEIPERMREVDAAFVDFSGDELVLDYLDPAKRTEVDNQPG